MRRPFSIAFPKGGVDQKLSPRTFPGPRLRGRSGSPFRGGREMKAIAHAS